MLGTLGKWGRANEAFTSVLDAKLRLNWPCYPQKDQESNRGLTPSYTECTTLATASCV